MGICSDPCGRSIVSGCIHAYAIRAYGLAASRNLAVMFEYARVAPSAYSPVGPVVLHRTRAAFPGTHMAKMLCIFKPVLVLNNIQIDYNSFSVD